MTAARSYDQREQRMDTAAGAELCADHVQSALRQGRVITRRAWGTVEQWVCMRGRNILRPMPEPTESPEARASERLMLSPPRGGLRPWRPSLCDLEAADWVVLW